MNLHLSHTANLSYHFTASEASIAQQSNYLRATEISSPNLSQYLQFFFSSIQFLSTLKAAYSSAHCSHRYISHHYTDNPKYMLSDIPSSKVEKLLFCLCLLPRSSSSSLLIFFFFTQAQQYNKNISSSLSRVFTWCVYGKAMTEGGLENIFSSTHGSTRLRVYSAASCRSFGTCALVERSHWSTLFIESYNRVV